MNVTGKITEKIAQGVEKTAVSKVLVAGGKEAGNSGVKLSDAVVKDVDKGTVKIASKKGASAVNVSLGIPESIKVYKKAVEVPAVRVTEKTLVPTLEVPEGQIANPGDWILTGAKGERWPIKDATFKENYAAVAGKPGTYAKLRIEVDGTQLSKPMTLKTSWGDMQGKPGDWLITDPKGSQWIVDAEVFKATYGKVH